MKHFLFVAIFTLFSNTLFFCTDSDNNPIDPKRPGVEIMSGNGIKMDTISACINLDFDVMVSVLFPDELDSISWQTENGFSGGLSLPEISESPSIKLSFTLPCTASLIVTGLRNNLAVASDTVVLFVSEPLTVNINPFRLYASPGLPCTLKVSVGNRYPWQQVTLIPQISDDSLFVWTPTTNDIGIKVPVSLIAIDNETTPVIAKDSVFITVIADNELLTPPANLKAERRTDDIVKISWDRDSLADSYILYRRDPDIDSTWETIALSNESYIDLTEKAIMYRVSSVNYFGASIPSEMIYLLDTVHYAHRIFFPDSISTVSEATALHFIKLQVARPAVNEITVWCSLSGDSEIDTDFGSSLYLAKIAPGDIFGLCTLSIIDDSLTEQNKYYSITIDSVSNGFINGQQFHNILLADDDSLLSVIYDANGAEKGNVPVDLRHYAKNDVAIVMGNTENLVRNGFFFAGWRNSTDTSGKLYNPGDTLIFDTTGIRLFAQWKVNKYYVIYDGKGYTGGHLPAIEQHKYQESITIAAKPDNLAKTGFTFKGWNTREDGTGDTLMPGDSLKIDTADITLYALWKINKYTVKYDGNGNDSGNVRDSADYEYGTEINTKDNSLNLSKKNYLFNGWNTARDGSGISIAPGDTFSLGASDITLYAQWRLSPPVITTHPVDTSVRAGNRVFLTVQVSGVGLSYQWQKNETDITGATSDTLFIDTVTRYDSASYRCTAGNAEGSVTSNSAVLKVISVASVSTGTDHTLILMTDSTAWGCGSNRNGKLNIGTEDTIISPAYIMSHVSMVSVSADVSFLLTKYGNIIKIQNNRRTILTSKATSVYAIPYSNNSLVLKESGSLFLYTSTDSTKLADSVSCFHGSRTHILIIKGGDLYALGENSKGQFGNGTYEGASEFINIESGVSFAIAGFNYSLILKNKNLFTAGVNSYGQFGNGTFQGTPLFTQVESNVSAISGSYSHTMIIKDNGTLYGAGFNEFYQLGFKTPSENVPFFIPVMTEVSSVSTGPFHTMIIKKDGTLWATGYNGQNQLGIEKHIDVINPELVKF